VTVVGLRVWDFRVKKFQVRHERQDVKKFTSEESSGPVQIGKQRFIKKPIAPIL
jgi:hypothetical protein